MFHFYKDILGLQLKLGDENSTYCEFETGSTDIAIFEKKMMGKAIGVELKNIDYNHNLVIVFPVMNVDEVYKRIKEKGIKFIKKPTTYEDWDVRAAQFNDPDGNLIEINTRIELLKDENSAELFL